MSSLERDGVALFYEEAGEGEAPVLLVHGWCCDHASSPPSSSTSRGEATASWPWTCAGMAGATSHTNTT